jgi:GPH family glycoside/pentoside/hexuronide:cation symporter
LPGVYLGQYPYSALTNRLTQHEASRSSLSVYRFVLAIVGYLIVSTTADMLISPFTDKQSGYVFAVSCFALLATFLFLACFGMTRERVGEEERLRRHRCGKCCGR